MIIDTNIYIKYDKNIFKLNGLVNWKIKSLSNKNICRCCMKSNLKLYKISWKDFNTIKSAFEIIEWYICVNCASERLLICEEYLQNNIKN